ncbi:MAG: YcjF family protein [Eggerthellaceae bacterium]
MQMPLNIGEVMKAAADTDAARMMPISIELFFDQDCGEDLRAFVSDAFATEAPKARVYMQDYPARKPELDFDTDLAVLVAGLSKNTGALCDHIRELGVPVMIVTVMPELVREMAQANNHPLLEEDIISPSVQVDGSGLPADHELNCEPYPLTVDRCRNLANRMGDWVVSTFREKRLAFALAFDFVRRPLSMEFTNATAIQNAGIGMVALIPGADMPVMTLNQAKMVLQIAAAYGQKLGRERAMELLAVVGGGFVCRSVARQLVSVVPAFGWVVKGGVGFAGTIAMGCATIAYFEALEGEGMHPEDALAVARKEAAKVKAEVSGKESPAQAALAGARMLVRDAADAGIEKARALAPSARGALREICEYTNMSMADVGRNIVVSIADQMKKKKD